MTDSRFRYWNEFPNTTNLQAIRLFTRSDTKIAKFWWGCVLLLTMTLTIRGLVRQIEMFISNPTVTKMSISQNRSISFLSDPTVCVEVSFPHFKYANEFETPQELEKWLSNYSYPIELSTTENYYSERLMFLLAQYVGTTSFFESALRGLHSDRNHSIYNQLWNYYQQPQLHEQLSTVHKFLTSKNISHQSVRNDIGERLCKLMKTTATLVRTAQLDTREVPLDFCVGKLVSWIGGLPFDDWYEEICIRFPKSSAKFDALGDIIKVRMDVSPLYQDFSSLAINDFRLYFLPEGGSVASDIPFVPIKLGEKVWLLGNVLGRYKVLDRPDSHCSHMPRQQCNGQCVAETIFHHCKCWSLAWQLAFSEEVSQFPICFNGNSVSYESTRKCLMSVRDTNRSDKCRQNCWNRCDSLKFYFHLAESVPLPDYNKSISMFEIQMYRFDYNLFLEIPLFDWDSFMASLGGALGLYLGATFTGLLHMIFTLIGTVMEAMKRALVE